MRGGLTGGGEAVARAPLPWLPVAFVPVALVVLAGGGSDPVRLAWVTLVALAALGVLGIAVLRGSLAPARPGPDALLLVGALAALVAWQGVSVLWSIEGDRTWEVFNRGLAYLAFLTLGWLAAAAADSVRAPATALAALLGTVVVWALLGAVIPALGPDTDRSARLQEPVQYWNGLALLLAVSLPLWLWLAARREHVPRVRAGATAMLFLALVALALTTSRGGVLAALAALGVWLVVARPRLESVGALALAGIPAVAVAVWALLGSVIADAGPLNGERRTDGAILGVLLVLGAAGVVVAALRLARLAPTDPVRRRIGRALLLAGAVAAVVAVVAVLVAVDVGQAWDDFRNPPAVQVTTGAGRVIDVSSNHRWTWWTQAWELFRDEPWAGWGAGTFELARRPIRQDSIAPLDPHDLPLAALAETGVVGFGAAARGRRGRRLGRGCGRLPATGRRAGRCRCARGRSGCVARPFARGHALAVRGRHGARALRARRARRRRPARGPPPRRPPRARHRRRRGRARRGRRLGRRPRPWLIGRRRPRSMHCSTATPPAPSTARGTRAASTRSRSSR